ncbi:hypothetical protein MB901379_01952 [Mycobacterium basiliense]|uniref:Secreted protein n=1 Tax=Mycobacterium basiliense TaxID=2094119 RepID=A0A3S5CZQ0_9MYCO|nr:hypothetical protein [Mycobacterium basiliense]VDM88390.1 hypothetical protein MB901379_01952 [Mycobacterium basiliense]
MMHTEDRPARLRMPRSRGAVTGILLVVLGAWGALIPFVGPSFDFGYTPGHAWTAARGWLEVLPGTVTAVAGLLLIISKNRASAVFGGWLAGLAGAWFVVGGSFAPLLRIGSVGDPVAVPNLKRALIEVSYFSGLGVVIVFLAGAVLSRLVARLARDVQPVTQPAEEPAYAVPAAEASDASEADETAESATTNPASEEREEEPRSKDEGVPQETEESEAATEHHGLSFHPFRRRRAGV